MVFKYRKTIKIVCNWQAKHSTVLNEIVTLYQCNQTVFWLTTVWQERKNNIYFYCHHNLLRLHISIWSGLWNLYTKCHCYIVICIHGEFVTIIVICRILYHQYNIGTTMIRTGRWCLNRAETENLLIEKLNMIFSIIVHGWGDLINGIWKKTKVFQQKYIVSV